MQLDRFPNLLFATVKSTKDPEKLARVQVEVLGFGQKLVLPWIRTLQGLAGKAHGTMVLPEVGDEVVVLCGAGPEPDGMVVLGGVYNSKSKPKEANADGKNALKQVLTKGGHRVTLDDTKGKLKIELVAAKEKISVKMMVKEGVLLLEANKDIQLKSAGKVTVDAKGVVTVKSKSKVVVDSPKIVALKKCTIEGPNLTIKASQVTVQGSVVTVDAKSTCAVKTTGALTLSGMTVDIG
jgi:uncharacterized protein involved in type VI secretion and phage assembly